MASPNAAVTDRPTAERKESAADRQSGVAEIDRPDVLEEAKPELDGATVVPTVASLKPKRDRRPLAIAIAIPVLIVVAFFGARWLAFNRSHVSTDDASVDGDVYPVSPKIAGRVSQVYISTNQLVKRGQLLAELDPKDLQAQLAAARANLAMEVAGARAAGATVSITQKSSSSALGDAEAGVEAAKAQIEASRQQVNAGGAQATAARAGLDAARQGVLDAGNSVTSSQAGVSSARSGLSAAHEGVESARQGVVGAKAGLRVAQQQVNVAAADVTAAEANARRATADAVRARSLFGQGAIAQSQLDAAEAAASTAESQTVAARQRRIAAEAGVDQARAALASAISRVHQASSAESQARAAVATAESSYRIAADSIKTAQAKAGQAAAGVQEATHRLAELAADVSQQKAKADQARASLVAATSAPQQVGVSRAQAQTALARVRQAQANVDALELQLSYTKLTAAHDGYIGQKNISVGQTVQIGQLALNVTDMSLADVVANFKETQLRGIRVGSPATFTVDAYPKYVFKGHVTSLSAGTGAAFSLLPPENASGNFTKVVQRVPVKIGIDSGIDADHPLRLGMSVTATVTTGR